MSYRLQSLGESTPDIFKAGYLDYTAGGKDGVVEGILDELEVQHEGNRIFIGRGKLMVSGYPVLFEGREVIEAPKDLPKLKHMIVGVLTVSGYKAKSFYLAIRQDGSLRQDEVNKTGEGVYEIKIVEFNIQSGRLTNVASALDKINVTKQETGSSSDFEKVVSQQYARAIMKNFQGDGALTDSQVGLINKFAILGDTTSDGEKIISATPKFSVIIHGKNYIDLRDTSIVVDNPNASVLLGNVMEDFWYAQFNTIEVSGMQENTQEPLSERNGFIRFNLPYLEAGKEYTMSIFSSIYFGWFEGNPEGKIAVKYLNNGTVIKSLEEKLPMPDEDGMVTGSKRLVLTFTALEGENHIDVLVGGSNLCLEEIQLEQNSTFTDFQGFMFKEYDFDLVDKKGTRHELNGIGEFRDKVSIKNGKVMLEKRLFRSNSYVTDVEYPSFYYTKDGLHEVPSFEFNEENEEILYVCNGITLYELNVDKDLFESIATFYPHSHISVIKEENKLSPLVSGEYAKSLDLVIKAIEEKLAQQ